MSLTRSDLEKGRLQEMIAQSNPTVSFLSEAELQASLSNTLQQQQPDSDVWLFAYGSLIWNPVFTFVERRMGMIYGFHRRFCLWVPAGRGTPENPGLVGSYPAARGTSIYTPHQSSNPAQAARVYMTT